MEDNVNEINLQQNTVNEPKIVQTDIGSKDGQNKCPRCGSTEIQLNVSTSKLRCNFCRHEFEPKLVEGLETDISKLKGDVIGSGASNIVADTNDVMTFKCSSCGSEVVIDTSEATQSRCHWCRNTLSINQQIPNGAVPDVVLPFMLKKDEAQTEIEKFVNKRKFYAHPKFKEEFTTQNIMGVYLPYMVVDLNSHATLIGQGEVLIREYTVGNGKNETTYYDADLYNIVREYDLEIEGLTIESSSDKLQKSSEDKTTNIINAIMPFDIEKSVKWDANYLRGYTSERRDTNIEELKDYMAIQAKDVSRHAANQTLTKYNRGVAWSEEHLDIIGQQWKAAYLPVWLYSYQEVKKSDKKLLHYVAVNARSKKTMGSVPIHMPKLILISGILEIIGLILMFAVDKDYRWVFAFLGFVYFGIIYGKYRNKGARHAHEKDTKTKMNMHREVDEFVTKRRGLTNRVMSGANNRRVEGSTAHVSLVETLVDNPLKSLNIGGKKKDDM